MGLWELVREAVGGMGSIYHCCGVGRNEGDISWFALCGKGGEVLVGFLEDGSWPGVAGSLV